MDDWQVTFILEIKNRIKSLENDIAHGNHTGKKYELGRVQGRLDGLEEGLALFENVLKDNLDDDID